MLRTGDVRQEGNVLTDEVYVVVKLTVTCEFTAPQEAEECQRKSGPEHNRINIEGVTGGEEFENAFEDKKSNGETVASGEPRSTFDPTEGVLEVRHIGEVEVAVELYV